MSEQRWQRLARRQWEVIRATLAPPWCREAVEVDLEWLRQRATYEGAEMPSTRQLAALWGCSQSRAARLLREAGADSGLTQRDSHLTQSDSPLTQPDSAGDEQAAILAAVDSHLTQRDSPLTQTDSPLTQSPEYSATILPSPAPKKEEGRRIDVPSAQPSLPLPLAAAAPTPTKKAKRPAGKALPEEVARVWEFYRSFHKLCGPVPTKGWAVEQAVAELGEQVVIDLIRWAHECPDEAAHRLRQENHVGETLFRPSKRVRYAELAERWLSGVGVPKVRQPDQRLPPKEQAKVRQQDEFERLAAAFASGEELVWEFASEQR